MMRCHNLKPRKITPCKLYWCITFTVIFASILVTGSANAQETHPTQNIGLIELVENSLEKRVDVNLYCEQHTCDALSLAIEFNPNAVQVMILDKGAFWQTSSNSVHILREHIDNEQGLIEFMYITEDQGGPPLHGSGTILQLTFIALNEAPTAFEIMTAEIATLTGETVLRYTSDSPPAMTSTPTPTATPEPVKVIMHVELEAAPPDQIVIAPLNNPQISVTAIQVGVDQAAFEVGLSSTNAAANDQLVVINAPAHLACLTDAGQAHPDATITLLAGDVNADGRVDISDSAAIGQSMQTGHLVSDVNRDNQVNVLDLIHIGRNYGAQAGACAP